MSKGERSRIRTRVRNATAAQAETQGRFLGGRPPYGYRLADAGPHPTPGKAALGIRIHRLEPDAATAPVVVRIFEEYVSGKGLFAIAESLTRDGVLPPSAYDRARNSHRNGEGWSKSAVRAILINPRYTGVAVWGRQRRDEVLVDVKDVAAGHRRRQSARPTLGGCSFCFPLHLSPSISQCPGSNGPIASYRRRTNLRCPVTWGPPS